jgi:hypothetical protein
MARMGTIVLAKSRMHVALIQPCIGDIAAGKEQYALRSWSCARTWLTCLPRTATTIGSIKGSSGYKSVSVFKGIYRFDTAMYLWYHRWERAIRAQVSAELPMWLTCIY